MRSTLLTALVCALLANDALAAEPRIFVLGVWPNRLRLFDEQTESFTRDLELRGGAVTNYGVIPHTPELDQLFFVTDRMETIEVVDVRRFEVVESFKLSTPETRVRISSLVPFPSGRRLYLRGGAVHLGADRYEREDAEMYLYDRDAGEVTEVVRLPEEIELGFFETLYVSLDEKSLFIVGETIWEIATDTHEIVDRIEWSKPSSAGYGGLSPMGFAESSPGVFHGPYATTDPVLEKDVWGIFRLDLSAKSLDRFELGPVINVDQLAISPDGSRAYAGLADLAVVDLEARKLVERREGFERGRTNLAMIVSADGSKLYVTGVGNAIDVYDTQSLEKLRSIFVGADITSPALPLPRTLFADP